jgi:alcohol dehydrogenase (NADP+)
MSVNFDFMLDTVSADHNLNLYVNLLKLDSTLKVVGAPEKHCQLQASA